MHIKYDHLWENSLYFSLLLPDINLVLVIFGYNLPISQICVYIEPGFPVPCKLLTNITNFLLGQSSYVFLPRTLLIKLIVH